MALRLVLGCHFLYEGVWKIKHRDTFTAEPFLTQAKGPIAPLFYAMVPDLDGRQRLGITAHANGKKSLSSDGIATRWQEIRQECLDFYRPAAEAGDATADAFEQLERAAEQTYKEYCKKLDGYLEASTAEITAHYEAIDRFHDNKEKYQRAQSLQKLRWDRMMEQRRKAAGWIKDIEAHETAFKNSLYDLLEDDQKKLGRIAESWNPFRWDRMDQINFAVTYGLTAIGLCLMLGFCTPLAALGGAGFMCFVVMTQPAFPGIYPPDPEILGHALLINKDFIEMVALLVVAATAAGRWGGLDFFLYRWIVNPLLAKKNKEQP